MVYQKKVLHFIPCHRKCSDQHSQCDIRAAQVDGFSTAFLYSDWLYFIWHGITAGMQSLGLHTCA